MSWFSPVPKENKSAEMPPKEVQIERLIQQHKLFPSVLNGFISTHHSPNSSSSVSKFLLPTDTHTFLHKSITSTQVFHFYEGAPVVIVELDKSKGSHAKFTSLGGMGNELQHIVEKGTWFGVYCQNASSGCQTPFTYMGITSLPDCNPDYDIDFASPQALKKQFPKAGAAIDKLTKGYERVIEEWRRRKSLRRLSSKDGSHPRPSFRDPEMRRNTNTEISHPEFRSTSEKPRQLVNSLVLFGLILYLGGFESGDMNDPKQAFRLSLGVVFLAFQVFAFLQVRDLITVFPHPGFWRLVFGWGAFYGMLLVAMSVLNHKDARWIFESVFGDFGTWKQWVKETEASKAETMGSCDVSPLAIFKQIFFAPWFLSHALGWMGKMMIFRDWGVCLIAALMFEFLELTFTYVVPEFEECWWDSVFLDTFGANLLGMWMGTHVNRWMSNYGRDDPVIKKHSKYDMSLAQSATVGAPLDWAGEIEEHEQENDVYISRVINPYSHVFQWRVFSSPVRLLQVMCLIFVMIFIELNTFLMMNVMGVPHDSIFNKLRLAVFGFLSMPAVAEFYYYVEQTRKSKSDNARIGPATWLVLSIAVLEHSLFWKFFPDHFVSELDKLHYKWIPMPDNILIPHLCSTVLFFTWFILRYHVIGRKIIGNESNTKEEEKKLNELLKEIRKNDGSTGSGSVVKRKSSIVKMLPFNVTRRVIMVESVDIILICAFLPLFTLTRYWKF